MSIGKNILVDAYLKQNLTQEQIDGLHISVDENGEIQNWPEELLTKPTEEQLEALRSEEETKKATSDLKKSLIEDGVKALERCSDALSFIRGFNRQPGRTKQQRDSMVSAFSDIKELLNDGRPEDALELIQQVIPDGQLVTQEMKDIVISLLGE